MNIRIKHYTTLDSTSSLTVQLKPGPKSYQAKQNQHYLAFNPASVFALVAQKGLKQWKNMISEFLNRLKVHPPSMRLACVLKPKLPSQLMMLKWCSDAMVQKMTSYYYLLYYHYITYVICQEILLNLSLFRFHIYIICRHKSSYMPLT